LLETPPLEHAVRSAIVEESTSTWRMSFLLKEFVAKEFVAGDGAGATCTLPKRLRITFGPS